MEGIRPDTIGKHAPKLVPEKAQKPGRWQRTEKTSPWDASPLLKAGKSEMGCGQSHWFVVEILGMQLMTPASNPGLTS